jgi:hypothetical protein
MNDEDFRDVCAMLTLNGYVSFMGCNPKNSGSICDDGEINAEAIARSCYIFADAMLEARKPKEEGLVAIKRKVKSK